jgi:hypothetical protein
MLVDIESTNGGAPPSPAPRVQRAREDLLLFTGSLFSGRRRRARTSHRTPCSFCGKTGRALKHLADGGRLMICESCVVEGTRLFSKDLLAAPPLNGGAKRVLGHCSGCGKRQTEVKGFFSARGHRVCDGCLFECLGILLEERVLVLD